MRLSNFNLVVDGGILGKDFAEVDATTGFWRWKKTVRRTIFRNGGGYWRFLGSGEFTPGSQAEQMYMCFEAKREFFRVMNR